MPNLIPRRRSKKQKALRAAAKTGKKAAKAKIVLSTAKGAKKGAGKAAKGGIALAMLAKARKPFVALGALAGGAILAKKLTSRSGDGTATPPTGGPTPTPA
jgi:hypothetical protein